MPDLPKLLQRLRKYRGRLQTQLGLRFLLLTGVRTGELRLATPDQFHLDQGLWIIPPEIIRYLLDHFKPAQRSRSCWSRSLGMRCRWLPLPLAAYAKLAVKSRRWISYEIRAGNLLALNVGNRGQRVPDWHLDPHKHALIQAVLKLNRDADPWKIYHALLKPRATLGRRAAIEAVTADNFDKAIMVVSTEVDAFAADHWHRPGARTLSLDIHGQNDGSRDRDHPEGSSLSRRGDLLSDKRNLVHILDSHNMPIVLRELDTVNGLAAYLDEKVRAASAFDYLSYCGEEDLLGHYLLNYDDITKRHVIGPKKDRVNGVMIGEGEWHDFVQTDLYKNTKNVDRISYFWDELIQRTCQNSLDGTLGGNSDILRGESAIYEMVKEPRFMRRGLAEKMLSAVERFPETGPFSQQVTFLPSFQLNVAYVLLQLRTPDTFCAEPDDREKRQTLLEIACGAAKNKFPYLAKVIGIGIDAPKFSGGTVAEDFILMPCGTWTDEMKIHYEELNKEWNFFGTPKMRQFNDRVTQFVPPQRTGTPATFGKVGRNDPCPCGSGKKYKKCHG